MTNRDEKLVTTAVPKKKVNALIHDAVESKVEINYLSSRAGLERMIGSTRLKERVDHRCSNLTERCDIFEMEDLSHSDALTMNVIAPVTMVVTVPLRRTHWRSEILRTSA